MTGAGGLIGSHAAATWSPESELVAIAREGGRPAPSQVAKSLTMDLSRPLDGKALPGKLDAVVHCAQSSRFREFPGGAADMEAINIRSALDLADYAVGAGARSFVYLSTGGVYRASESPLAECDAVKPESFYAATKAAAEQLLAHYSDLLNVVVLRPFFVFGPGQEAMLVPNLITKVDQGEEIVVAGKNGMRTNPTFVDDAVEMVRSALDLDASATINLAGDETLSLREMAEEIGRVLGKPAKIASDPPTTSKPIDLVPDLDTCRRELRPPPSRPFAEGIAETCLAMGLSVAREQ